MPQSPFSNFPSQDLTPGIAGGAAPSATLCLHGTLISGTLSAHLPTPSFIHLMTHSFIHSLPSSLIHSSLIHSLTGLLIPTLTNSLIHLFIHSPTPFVHSSAHSFTHLLPPHSYTIHSCSFTPSFSYSFIFSLTYSFTYISTSEVLVAILLSFVFWESSFPKTATQEAGSLSLYISRNKIVDSGSSLLCRCLNLNS